MSLLFASYSARCVLDTAELVRREIAEIFRPSPHDIRTSRSACSCCEMRENDVAISEDSS